MLLRSRFLANSILKNIKKEVSTLQKKPGLGIILVGDRKDSKIYVNMKKKACEKVGIKHYQKNLCSLSTTETVINQIEKFNKNDNIDAIMVQLPLPEHLNQELILNKINSKKDVDCFHKINFGKIALNLDKLSSTNDVSGIIKSTPGVYSGLGKVTPASTKIYSIFLPSS